MKLFRPLFLTACAVPLLAGCIAVSPAERAARDRVQTVGAQLRPGGHRPTLPELRPDSTLPDYLRFALLNHPQVEAAYLEWRGTVEAVTSARSLPDPKFTFESDITDRLMTFMPGLMFDLMTPAKRAAVAREAAAGSETAYRAYVVTVLQVAAAARQAWIELAYLDAARQLHLRAVREAGEALDLAGAGYATGRGMVGLEKQVLFQNKAAEHHLHHHVFSDRLAAARARFKSALGLQPGDPDPLWPGFALSVTPLPAPDELWRRTQVANPELARMRAMVEMAVASLEVARQAGTPDFSLGAMADLNATPLLVRPTATLTLPVWRKKLAALAAAAGARREAAAARVSAEQLNLAAELAQMLSLVREADRMLSYFDATALPNLERIIATAEAGYQSGQADPAAIPETRLMATDLRIERLAALRDRESAVTNLLLLTAAVAPADAPLGSPAALSAARQP